MDNKFKLGDRVVATCINVTNMTGTVCEVENIEHKFNRFSKYVRVKIDSIYGLSKDNETKLFSISDLELIGNS